ncbi:MAG TPA: bacillithiol system redox-active protein YtxJ [Candidatus Paceibacterota bacterium]|jgi:bacillithiol system protein YtxJ|nr:bacillithiol system redox-active protein YtxJ [Candidatus Paceibacterota bacterium]
MKQIYTPEEWEAALEESKSGPIVIYKHSTACAGCERQLSEMHEGVAYKEITRPVYYVVVQESGELSKRIADDLQIPHQSPQAIIVINGRACYDAYADEISASVIAARIHLVQEAFDEISGSGSKTREEE